MMVNYPEHGVILLKPDGVEAELEQTLYKYLESYELSVMAQNKTTLIPNQVVENIRTSFDNEQYANYLCSGPIIAIMVKGDYAIDKLIKIKRKIRSDFGVTCDDMKNFIHSADLGNEHYIHTKYLFPNLDVCQYGLYADMNVYAPLEYIFSEIIKVEKNKSVTWIGLIIDFWGLKSSVEKIKLIHSDTLNILYGVRFSCRVKQDNMLSDIIVIGYFMDLELILSQQIQESMDVESCFKIIHGCKGIAVLDYAPYQKEKSDKILSDLKLIGLDGVVVYDVRYSLNEVARLEYVSADILDLLLTGGSNGQINSGSLSIDRKTFEIFMSKMKEYQ